MTQEVSQVPLNSPDSVFAISDETLLFTARLLVVMCALFLPISLAVSNIVFIAASVVSCVRWGGRSVLYTLKTHPVAPTFLGYFLLLALGLVYTSAPLHEALPMFAKYGKLLLAIPLFAIEYDEKWFRYTLLAFVSSMVLTMFLGYLKILGIWNLNPEMGPVSVFSRHITTSWFMSIASFFVLNYFLNDVRKRAACGLLLALMIYYLLFCNEGRTGYVVICVLFAYALWWHANWRGLLIATVAIPVLITCAYWFSPHFQERVQDMIVTTQAYNQGDETATSMSLRIRYVQNSLKIIRANPIIGTGTGSVLHEMQKIEPNPEFQIRNPHNEFVNQWVQLGTIGLLCWLAFLAWQWICAGYYAENRQTVIRGVILALVSGSLMNSLLMDALEGHLYVFFIAIAMAIPQREKNNVNHS